jgi:hypothetical protein
VRTHRRQATSDAGGSARRRRLQVGIRAGTTSRRRLPRRSTSSGSCVGIPDGVGFDVGIFRDGPGWAGMDRENTREVNGLLGKFGDHRVGWEKTLRTQQIPDK